MYLHTLTCKYCTIAVQNYLPTSIGLTAYFRGSESEQFKTCDLIEPRVVVLKIAIDNHLCVPSKGEFFFYIVDRNYSYTISEDFVVRSETMQEK